MNDSADRNADLKAGFDELNRRLVAGIASPLQTNRLLGGAELVKSLTAGLVHDTERLIEIQSRYYRKHLELWGDFAPAPTGATPPAAKAPADRRFSRPEW